MTENMKAILLDKDESELTISEKRIMELFARNDINVQYSMKYQSNKKDVLPLLELSIRDISKELKLTIQWIVKIVARLVDNKEKLQERYYKPDNQRGFYVYSIKKK